MSGLIRIWIRKGSQPDPDLHNHCQTLQICRTTGCYLCRETMEMVDWASSSSSQVGSPTTGGSQCVHHGTEFNQ